MSKDLRDLVDRHVVNKCHVNDINPPLVRHDSLPVRTGLGPLGVPLRFNQRLQAPFLEVAVPVILQLLPAKVDVDTWQLVLCDVFHSYLIYLGHLPGYLHA